MGRCKQKAFGSMDIHEDSGKLWTKTSKRLLFKFFLFTKPRAKLTVSCKTIRPGCTEFGEHAIKTEQTECVSFAKFC